ncbi:MAG: hypothetical protein WCD35_06030 [Mycobacteriales bacterium]
MRHAGARRGLVVCALGLLTVLGLAVVPAQAANGDLSVQTTVGGRSLKDASANSPLALRPTDDTVVKVVVTNHGTSPVEVRAVRLDARVLGLAFFSYTTRVDLTLAPGATGTRTFALDLGDLDGQATGLLPAEVALLAPDRSVLASTHGTVDVKGRLLSVYGVFGLAVAAITGLLLLTLVLRMFRRTLPDSRWSRALLFAVPGLGLGLVATFSLGALRVLVPSLQTSIGLLIGGLVVGIALGSLTPAPGDEADRDELDERDLLTVAPEPDPAPVAPAPAAATLRPAPVTVMPEVQVPPQTSVVAASPSDTLTVSPEAEHKVEDPRQTRLDGAPPPPPPPPPPAPSPA